MNHDLFRRYVWLVDLLSHTPRMTYEEISANWAQSPVNHDNQPFPLRTFHNHRNSIERIFGIRIDCLRRQGNCYEIAEDSLPGLTQLRVWMLQTLASPLRGRDHSDIENRIVLDDMPASALGLLTIIEGISTNTAVDMEYGEEKLLFEPYCVGYFDNEWLLAGMVPAENQMRVIKLKNVGIMDLTHWNFDYPPHFSPREFFREYAEINDRKNAGALDA